MLVLACSADCRGLYWNDGKYRLADAWTEVGGVRFGGIVPIGGRDSGQRSSAFRAGVRGGDIFRSEVETVGRPPSLPVRFPTDVLSELWWPYNTWSEVLLCVRHLTDDAMLQLRRFPATWRQILWGMWHASAGNTGFVCYEPQRRSQAGTTSGIGSLC